MPDTWQVKFEVKNSSGIETAICRVDGEDIGLPLAGSKTIRLEVGTHRIYLRVRGRPDKKWKVEYSSKGFALKPDDARTVAAIAHDGGGWASARFTLKPRA